MGGGYRGQIKRACRELGRRGRTFDWVDVHNHIPKGAYHPTEWQLIRFLEHYPGVEVAEQGNRHRRTKYRLVRYRRKTP